MIKAFLDKEDKFTRSDNMTIRRRNNIPAVGIVEGGLRYEKDNKDTKLELQQSNIEIKNLCAKQNSVHNE
jgi:hypothetical protein